MKRGFVPVLVMFGLAAAGLFAARETIDTKQSAAEPAAAVETTTKPAERNGPGRASLKKEDDGHYWASAQINGATIRLMVDTGASVVALTPRDARRAGLDIASLPKTAHISTANGEIIAGVAMLKRVKIAGIEVTDVQAVVVEEGLSTSLLGMSFLNRLKGWQTTPTALLLKE
jgi:aspartyl protease family protein